LASENLYVNTQNNIWKFFIFFQLDPGQPVKYLVKKHFREITAYDKTNDICYEQDIKTAGSNGLSIIQDDVSWY